jgi:transmembrane sensor
MNVSDQLLDKYFKNQCTPEERFVVAEYLSKIESFPNHFVTKEEWDDTQDAVFASEKSDQIFEKIRKQTFAKNIKLGWLKITAIAALLLITASVGLLVFKQSQKRNPLVKNERSSPFKANVINWKSVVNYTNRKQEMTLPDGSIINIYPGAELRYAQPFVQQKREVYLKGKSFFQVSKDKKHPFVVYAKGISTTALGTSFTITAVENSKLLKVQLHTGKVWIKNVDSTDNKTAFNKILLPGEALVFNRSENKVQMLTPKTMLVKKENKTELNFTQVPLATVFSTLEEHYKIKISYNASDLEEISFTGSLKLTQPIDKILKELTELNKLKQSKTPEGYQITN